MGILISGGVVVSLDPAVGDLHQGDVLVEDDRIVAVAERIDAPDADVLDATGMAVLPGFVDTHRHTWQTAFRGIGADWTFAQYRTAMHGTLRPHYTPEDVYLGNLLGRLEALHSGITTMVDWFHCSDSPEHADAAVAALRDSGARSVFCYGAHFGPADTPIDAELTRVRDTLTDPDALVTMSLGLRGPLLTTMDVVHHDVALARDLKLRTSVHIGSGGATDRTPITDMGELGLVDEHTTIVHGNGLRDRELALLADVGASVSVSPDVELKMGFGWPETGRMLAAGIRPSLSIDDCPSVGGDMFSTMRTTLSVQRGLATAEPAQPAFTAGDVLKFATVNGAITCGLGDRVGSITPGKQADLVLLRTDDPTVFPFTNPAGTIIAAGHPGLVDTVLVAGRVVKRDGVLVGHQYDTLRERLLASRGRIAAAAGIRLDVPWIPRTE